MEINEGLTSKQAEELLKKFGNNELPSNETGTFIKILKKLIAPTSLMLLLASLLSLIVHKYFDFYFILLLLFINQAISFWQENKADKAIKKLNEKLITRSEVLRNANWKTIDSNLIVPGDIVKLSVGSLVPADGRILDQTNLTVNESVLSGESFPKEKKKNQEVFSGSFVDTGEAVICITHTGNETYFGKTLNVVERKEDKSLLEKDILQISKFLSLVSVLAVLVFTTTAVLQGNTEINEIIILDLGLIIAGIPISLQTVMTLIIELGVVELSKKDVIVRKLSALEELSNVTLLLTDKTGTLTQNEINVNEITEFNNYSKKEIINFAHFSAERNKSNSIDKAILNSYGEFKITETSKVVKYIPPDSIRKRSTIRVNIDNKDYCISIGAPQIIRTLLSSKNNFEKYDKQIDQFAEKGFRTISIAVSSKSEKDMELAGLIALSDTIRPEAKSVIKFLKDNGIKIIMLTGDHSSIAKHVLNEAGIGNRLVYNKAQLDSMDLHKLKEEEINQIGAFAEILPKDKFNIVSNFKQNYIVAVNGDGINDLPAVKEANVGIAVKNAVDALKSAADFVLLSHGLSVIKDSIIESRKIFARVYSYSVYRISESFRLIITTTVLALLYKAIPITPVQIIMIALLNDIPIISLAFDRVKTAHKPQQLNVKERLIKSVGFGFVGILNSLLIFFLMHNVWHLSWEIIQTVYFLKLTVSGHMLIYVAHTSERWYKFLPSKQVILATTGTQLIATFIVLFGIGMPTSLSIPMVIFVWIWSFVWMQVGEGVKILVGKLEKK